MPIVKASETTIRFQSLNEKSAKTIKKKNVIVGIYVKML
jgi:hypothetical protein